MQCDTHTQTLVLAGPADYRTPILDWCAVRLHRSGFCALLRAETAPFCFLPRSYSSSSAGPRASFQSTVGGRYLFCLTILCRAPSPWTRGKRPSPCGSFPPTPKCSETVMVMTAMIAMAPLFTASTHRLSGLHCSATFIKSQWSIYDCE